MESKVKLHLGCGDKRIPGFINVDIRESEYVDEVDDVATLVKYNNNSVDLIYVSHVLEHFGRNQYKKVLGRWFELLNKGGVLRLAVPDFEAVIRIYTQTGNLKDVMGLLYGGQTYPQNYHYCTFDFNSLKFDLLEIGFTNVERFDWRKTEHSGIDDFSQAYFPHMDKENGILASLNVEATK